MYKVISQPRKSQIFLFLFRCLIIITTKHPLRVSPSQHQPSTYSLPRQAHIKSFYCHTRKTITTGYINHTQGPYVYKNIVAMTSQQDNSIPSTSLDNSRRSSASSASTGTDASSAASSQTQALKLSREMNPSAFVSEAPAHPLPAYAREFPKPASDIDIDEALSRKPGRWTFRGSVEASINRPTRTFSAEYSQEQARAEAYAAAKDALRQSAAQMNATKIK